MKRIGILETGRPSPQIMARFGDSPKMFRDYFGRSPVLSFVTYSVFQGDALPDIHDCDAFLITGSSCSVYDALGWIQTLIAFIREAVAHMVPVLGICFGHQVMAQAFGGQVKKSDQGRGIGLHQHVLTDEGKRIFAGFDSLSLMAAHQDQVVVPPPKGNLLATSRFCAFAAYAYEKSGLSLQGHPEIVPDFERQIIHDWQHADPVDLKIVDQALSSLTTNQSDALQLQPFLARFLAGDLILDK